MKGFLALPLIATLALTAPAEAKIRSAPLLLINPVQLT